MREIRCIMFSDTEICQAVIDLRRKSRGPLPNGALKHVRQVRSAEGVTVTLTIVSNDGVEQQVVVPPPEMAAALVGWCLSRKIPLPAHGEKWLEPVGGDLALFVTPASRRSRSAAPQDATTVPLTPAVAGLVAQRLADWLDRRLSAVGEGRAALIRWSALGQELALDGAAITDLPAQIEAVLPVVRAGYPAIQIEAGPTGMTVRRPRNPNGPVAG